ECLSDLEQRTDPVGPPRRGATHCSARSPRSHRRKKVREVRFPPLGWPPCCTEMDWDGPSCIIQYFRIMLLVNKDWIHYQIFLILITDVFISIRWCMIIDLYSTAFLLYCSLVEKR